MISPVRQLELRIRTPEGVQFSHRLASPVLRMCAWVIDVSAVSAAWGVLSALIGLLGLLSWDVAGLVLTVSYFALSQGYRILAEWRWRGQTLGKRVFRLRVIDAGGFPLTLSQTLLRNILRFADALPAAYLIGGVSALLSRQAQRLGDIAAGTLVIWEPSLEALAVGHLETGKYNSLREHTAVAARLRNQIPPEEARLAWQALARRDRLAPADRLQLFADLAALLRRRSPMPPELSEGITDEQFVRNVVEVLYLTPG
ncbi:RDD family protein [Nibricoccus sp. IMCC34717]|uniref:RDD family protein n=1 Tax=Nibricoccus sp. IMCC34717 TaxID=3034021 RepID=UPI00384CE122